MKIIRNVILMLLVTTAFACQDIELKDLSAENTMRSITLSVVTEQEMDSLGSKPVDKTIDLPGTIASNGLVSFEGVNELTDDQKKRGRFSAIIPQTAIIVEKDGAGNIIGNGIGGQRVLSRKTYYFYVVAANGDERKYVITFN